MDIEYLLTDIVKEKTKKIFIKNNTDVLIMFESKNNNLILGINECREVIVFNNEELYFYIDTNIYDIPLKLINNTKLKINCDFNNINLYEKDEKLLFNKN